MVETKHKTALKNLVNSLLASRQDLQRMLSQVDSWIANNKTKGNVADLEGLNVEEKAWVQQYIETEIEGKETPEWKAILEKSKKSANKHTGELKIRDTV